MGTVAKALHFQTKIRQKPPQPQNRIRHAAFLDGTFLARFYLRSIKEGEHTRVWSGDLISLFAGEENQRWTP